MTVIDAAPRAADTPTFADLGLPTPILRRLAEQRIELPFPIQASVIPDVLAGRDVAGRAPTGSGKTLGFGLPLVAGLTDARPKRPVALVLAPTRELAEQIVKELAPFVKAMGHHSTAVYGGVGYGGQRKALDRGCELVVACPGRLEDLIGMRAIDLRDVVHVVVDEADQMADMGFLPAVRRIVEQTSTDRQVLLFSATLDGPVKKLVDDFQQDPARHEVGEKGPDMESADHRFWLVDRVDRVAVTADIIDRLGPTIVFTRTRHGADRVAKQLARRGVAAEPIHGGRSQAQRDRALAAFKSGSSSALIATDVAARGIHVVGVSAVVHFDPPSDEAVYLHRSGRTARAGATGTVVSLVDDEQRKASRALQRVVGLPPGFDTPDVTSLSTAAAAEPVATTRSTGDTAHAVSERTVTKVTGGTSVNGAIDGAGETGETGIVKFFNAGRGYGFIRRDAGGSDLFVHHTNIAGDGFRTLDGDARVRFTVADGRRGPEAFAVTVV